MWTRCANTTLDRQFGRAVTSSSFEALLICACMFCGHSGDSVSTSGSFASKQIYTHLDSAETHSHPQYRAGILAALSVCGDHLTLVQD